MTLCQPFAGCEWDFDITLNPRQRPVAFNGVYLGTFFSRQLDALHYWLAINHRSATANGPYTRTVLARCCAVSAYAFADTPQPVSVVPVPYESLL